MKNRFTFRCWVDHEKNEKLQKYINEQFDDVSFLRHCKYYVYSDVIWSKGIGTNLEVLGGFCGLDNDEFEYYESFLNASYWSTVWLEGIVEQCTSEKDENGQLIYEGDILEYKDTLYVVKWDTNFNRFEAMSKYCSGYNITSTFTSQCKIVGNIHEDREFYEKNH